MYNRRSFLQAGAAASSVSAIGGAMGAWPSSVLAATSSRIDFYKVVFDQGHPAAVVFGHAAEAAGLPAQAIGRDVTSLWYDDLYHRWRQGPAAIAGLTPVRIAFCLQMLGQDVGMRLVFRAEHTPMGDGTLKHKLAGPKSILERAAVLDTSAGWSHGAAALVSQCPAEFSSKSTRALTSASATGFAFREPLVSWVIAPVSRT
jgi:hypothetical protein